MRMKGWTAAFLKQCNVSGKHRPAMTQQGVTANKNIAHAITKLLLYHKSIPKQVTESKPANFYHT